MNPLRQFDLNLLIIFEALISECHVSRAAEKVFLSQSATSHALNRLRQQLDDPILVRTENGLQATPRALSMLPQVQEALKLVERTITPPKPFDPLTDHRQFHIACTDYFEAVLLPDIASQLQQTAPNVSLEIEMIGPNASHQRLDNRQVDLVVGLDESESIPNHLIKEEWHSQQMVCLATSDHPSVHQTLSLTEFTQMSHVVFSDLTTDSVNTIDDWLTKQGLQRHHIARTVNYMAAASIVAKTEAVMTLPLAMAKLFSSMLNVKIVQPPAGLPPLNMTMIYHPLYAMDPALIWLRQLIHQYSTFKS